MCANIGFYHPMKNFGNGLLRKNENWKAGLNYNRKKRNNILQSEGIVWLTKVDDLNDEKAKLWILRYWWRRFYGINFVPDHKHPPSLTSRFVKHKPGPPSPADAKPLKIMNISKANTGGKEDGIMERQTVSLSWLSSFLCALFASDMKWEIYHTKHKK